MEDELTCEEVRLLDRADRQEKRGIAWFYIMFILLVCAAGVFFWQCYVWLRSAEWPTITLATIEVQPLGSEWQGLNEIYQYVLDMPLALTLLLSAVVAGWVGTWNDSETSTQLYLARKKRDNLLRKKNQASTDR